MKPISEVADQYITSLCEQFLRKNYYLRKRLIFMLELFICTLSTALTLSVYVSALKSASLEVLAGYIIGSGIISSFLLYAMRTSYNDIRHLSLHSIVKIIILALLKVLTIIVFIYAAAPHIDRLTNILYLVRCGFIDVLATIFGLLLVRLSLAGIYRLYHRGKISTKKNALLFEPSSKNFLFADFINCSEESDIRVVGFMTAHPAEIGMSASGLRIYNANKDAADLLKLVQNLNIKCIIFPSLKHAKTVGEQLAQICLQNNIQLMMCNELVPLSDLNTQKQFSLKPIKIEELLSREEISVNIEGIKKEIQNDVILVTGAAGSIGSEIARQLAQLPAKQLILVDIAESPLHALKLEFDKTYPHAEVIFKIGNVTNRNRMSNLLKRYNPSIIFHAAAYKHVPMMEDNPSESITTNVGGSVNLAKLAIEHGIRKFVMVSTDKAVNPSNIMGATKRLAEMFVQSQDRKGKTQFITTRFGNVLGSNGSVIPIFVKQIQEGGPITITHPEIIRYFMSIPEACRLVLQAATLGQGGQILLFDMGKPQSILELAKRLIRLYGLEPDVDINIVFTGLRPGEKLYEELLTTHENSCATSHEKIRIADCAAFDTELISQQIETLLQYAEDEDVAQTVRYLKKLVPEYISKNNETFANFDLERETTPPTPAPSPQTPPATPEPCSIPALLSVTNTPTTQAV